MFIKFVQGMVTAILFLALAAGVYWSYKIFTYPILYEDMVKQTITEMVKKEALK